MLSDPPRLRFVGGSKIIFLIFWKRSDQRLDRAIRRHYTQPHVYLFPIRLTNLPSAQRKTRGHQSISREFAILALPRLTKMDLNTISEIARPTNRAGVGAWRGGDAWLAGGTWLFSEPQPGLRRLIDLQGLAWEPLHVSDQGLTIAATCTIRQLNEVRAPPQWKAASLIRQCIRSFLSSFKIWNTATVGGNVCMSLPAGPMISLTAALEGVCTIWQPDGGERRVPVIDFVTGDHQNVLRPGELLRSIELPASALQKRPSFRRMTLTHLGRSTALLIGTLCPHRGKLALTVTAATVRPVRLEFASVPTAAQ
jgi:CO/xanthine dehydrogenase FAD-binding subunit